MATYAKINDWVNLLIESANPDTDNFSIALSNTAPASEGSNPTVSGNGILANVTQISYTNYSDTLAVDRRLEGTAGTSTGGVYKFDADDFTITASGGAIAGWRYLYVFDDTLTDDPLVAVWDYGSTLDIADGDSVAININAAGLFTVT